MTLFLLALGAIPEISSLLCRGEEQRLLQTRLRLLALTFFLLALAHSSITTDIELLRRIEQLETK